MRQKFEQPIQLRYSVVFELSNGVDVWIGFDRMNEALSFAKKINYPGEYWEVLDNKTGNVVGSAKEDQ